MKRLSAKASVKVAGTGEGKCFLKYSCRSVLITASDKGSLLASTLSGQNDLKFKP